MKTEVAEKKTMTTEDYVELFVTFLREKGAYNKFCTAYDNCYKRNRRDGNTTQTRDVSLFIKKYCGTAPDLLFFAAFIWGADGGDIEFWAGINEEWQELIK